jgi:hypothetical protein
MRLATHEWEGKIGSEVLHMSTVEEITAAIRQLPKDDVARVQIWLEDFAERLWDEQIERDERAGRLDALIDKALEEHRAGRTRPL